MSKGNVKQWYMRLNSTTFSDPRLKRIKHISPTYHGRFFGSFVIALYFELICESIPTDGYLVYNLMFTEEESISYIIAEHFYSNSYLPDVKEAIHILQSEGLIEIMENNEENKLLLYIPTVQDNTGSTSLDSEERRQRRIAAKGKLLEGSSEILTAYGETKNVFLTENEYQSIIAEYENAEGKILAYGYYKIGNNQNKKDKESDYNKLKEFIRDKIR